MAGKWYYVPAGFYFLAMVVWWCVQPIVTPSSRQSRKRALRFGEAQDWRQRHYNAFGERCDAE